MRLGVTSQTAGDGERKSRSEVRQHQPKIVRRRVREGFLVLAVAACCRCRLADVTRDSKGNKHALTRRTPVA